MKIPICILLFVLVALIAGFVVIAAGPLLPPGFALWKPMAVLAPDWLDGVLHMTTYHAAPPGFLFERGWSVLIGLAALGAYVLAVPMVLGAVAQRIWRRGRLVFAGSVFLVGLWMGVRQILPAGLGSVLEIGFGTLWTGAVVGLFLAAGACVLSDAAGLTWQRGTLCLVGVVVWGVLAVVVVAIPRQELAQLINPRAVGEQREALKVIVDHVCRFVSVLLMAAVPAVLFRALCRRGRGAFAVFAAMFALYPAWRLAATWSLSLLAGFGIVLGLALACAAAAWSIGGLWASGMRAPRPAGDMGPGSVGEARI